MYKQITANKRKTWILIIAFTIFVIALGWIFSSTLEMGPIAIIIAAIIALLMSLTGYYKGDRVALTASGAKPISQKESPYVYRIIENLAITAGIPVPKIYIIADPVPNAFATGRDPEHSSMALTSGLIELMAKEELEGVVAHEISHIKNYDIRVMTLVVILVGLVALLADFFIRIQFYGFGKRRSRSQGSAGAILLVIGIVLAILSPIIAQIIQLAVSRKREFLADASGSLLTRYPEGLASALNKIASHPQKLRRANRATAHLFFSSPFANSRNIFNRFFMTHPPIQDRITALKQMATAGS